MIIPKQALNPFKRGGKNDEKNHFDNNSNFIASDGTSNRRILSIFSFNAR